MEYITLPGLNRLCAKATSKEFALMIISAGNESQYSTMLSLLMIAFLMVSGMPTVCNSRDTKLLFIYAMYERVMFVAHVADRLSTVVLLRPNGSGMVNFSIEAPSTSTVMLSGYPPARTHARRLSLGA
jgi:hypothetical protein